MRRVLTSMRPTKFDHIVAVLALYRPGPMEFIDEYIAGLQGKEPSYTHPALEPILRETFGICVYQEQIIRILTDIAGYTPGEADLVRKAVGKKIREQLVRHRESFVQGAREHSGIDEESANRIFDSFEYFARYGFNKAHASDYAIITVQTAYLKAHYPVEYMTALLTVEQGNTEKVGLLIAEARRLGIEVLPPSVNQGGIGFTIEDGNGAAIRYGLGAIKNVGEGPVEAILEARDSTPFADVDDFCQRVDLRLVNRRALECLIKAGALADLGGRAQLLAVMDRMISISQQAHGAALQFSMFDMAAFANTARLAADLPAVADVSRRDALAWEKELVGAYISDHPLSRVWADLENTITVLSGQVEETMNGQKVTMAGMLNSLRRIMTKKGQHMAFAQLEDLQGPIEVVIFPSLWEETAELWQPERILVVRGKVSFRGRDPSIIAESVTNEITKVHAPDEAFPPHPPEVARGPVHLHVTVPRQGDVEQTIKRLGKVYDLLVSYPGNDHFSLYVENGGQARVQIQFPNDTTDHSLELEQRIREMLGAGTVQVEEWTP